MLSIIVPLLGIILGIAAAVFSRKALKRIEQSNEEGRGLAIAGFICGLIGMVVQLYPLLSIFA
ncbi:DUF4190 domain-containing protein [Bacillus sp. FJAT-42376]|nr:DUF4190 domain-containing protein [Bacillus sp. FJAT-42376]